MTNSNQENNSITNESDAPTDEQFFGDSAEQTARGKSKEIKEMLDEFDDN